MDVLFVGVFLVVVVGWVLGDLLLEEWFIVDCGVLFDILLGSLNVIFVGGGLFFCCCFMGFVDFLCW